MSPWPYIVFTIPHLPVSSTISELLFMHQISGYSNLYPVVMHGAKCPQLETITSCWGGTLLAQDVKWWGLFEWDMVLSVMDFMMFLELSHYTISGYVWYCHYCMSSLVWRMSASIDGHGPSMYLLTVEKMQCQCDQSVSMAVDIGLH